MVLFRSIPSFKLSNRIFFVGKMLIRYSSVIRDRIERLESSLHIESMLLEHYEQFQLEK